MTIFATVLFGSQVSGNADKRSDRDLLVVCSPEDKKASIKKYAQLGYSVSAYTPTQLESMKLQGSLFLQHLKHESQVISDPYDFFNKFISQCSFIPPSVTEMERSKKCILNALSSPVEMRTAWWLADFLFVLSRDYFIKYFAKNGKFVFNSSQLSIEIKKEFNLSSSEAQLFTDLRRCKSIYRNMSSEKLFVEPILFKWERILLRILKTKTVVKASPYNHLFGREADEFESNYELLRYIESLRLMFPEIECEREKEAYIHKMIVTPNHYSSTTWKRKNFLSEYLSEYRVKAQKHLVNINHQCYFYSIASYQGTSFSAQT